MPNKFPEENMYLDTIIEKLNDVYFEEGEITIIMETSPNEYKSINFINVIENDKNKKFVVLS